MKPRQLTPEETARVERARAAAEVALEAIAALPVELRLHVGLAVVSRLRGRRSGPRSMFDVDPSLIDAWRAFRAQGLSTRAAAKRIGCDPQTIWNYRRTHPEANL